MSTDGFDNIDEVGPPPLLGALHYEEVVSDLQRRGVRAEVKATGMSPIIEVVLPAGKTVNWVNSETGWWCFIPNGGGMAGSAMKKSSAPYDALPDDVAQMIDTIDYEAM